MRGLLEIEALRAISFVSPALSQGLGPAVGRGIFTKMKVYQIKGRQ